MRARVARRRRASRVAAGSVVLVAALGVAGSAAAGQGTGATGSAHMYGEYGLYVGITKDSLDVRWVTTAAGPGFAALSRGGAAFDSAVSPTGRGHVLLFRRPKDDSVLLRYGAVGDSTDRHETTLLLDEPQADRNPVYPAPDSLYVIGDIHGEFDNLIGTLRNAGLIDADRRWSGGHAQLAAVGDLVDRGQDATKVLWYLYRLEREAAAAGGVVRVVLGDHELMVMTNDLRYTRGKELLTATLEGMEYWQKFDPNRSILGRWLASKPALLRVGDVLLVHGGLTDAYGKWPLRQFQDSLTSYIHGEVLHLWADSTYRPDPHKVRGIDRAAVHRRYDFFFSDSSVFWYRGYVNESSHGAELARVLKERHADLQVVGHTIVPSIQEMYGDSLIAVDMRNPATEILLLERRGDGWARFRIREQGSPEPLPGGGAAASTAADSRPNF